MLSATRSETAARSIDACPACGAANPPSVGTAGRAFGTVIGTRNFIQPEYAVRDCRSCGLLFKSVVLSAAELDSYYRDLDAAIFEHDGSYPTDQILRKRLRRLPAGARVLDFGCSTGRLLRDLTTRLSCSGVEPNHAAAAMARQRGIEIVAPESLTGSFDAILLADVYEHLSHPVPVIELLVPRLAPGGWLAIVTGDADAATPRQRVAEFWYFRMPGHLLMASERHFSWLARRTGLELEAIHRCSHYSVPASERLVQCVRAYIYDRFRDAPSSIATRVMRLIPRVRSAERWETAPAVTYRNDHLVAIFRRRGISKERHV